MTEAPYTYDDYISAVRRINSSPLAALGLGLAGEYAEWADTNFKDKKEQGDLLWYVTAIAMYFGFHRPEDAFRLTLSLLWGEHVRLDTPHTTVLSHVGAVCELLKKHIAHNQLISDDPERRQALREHLVAITVRLWSPEVAKANDEKLRARHPDGFPRDPNVCNLCGTVKLRDSQFRPGQQVLLLSTAWSGCKQENGEVPEYGVKGEVGTLDHRYNDGWKVLNVGKWGRGWFHESQLRIVSPGYDPKTEPEVK